ncbi:hypothetical protein BDZ91DRAFT_798835 [Kalaharituber pfeilii]|nr:hypothetical protein BDZ91DRAFT_798835 [Kalaharituber pfeilii]
MGFVNAWAHYPFVSLAIFAQLLLAFLIIEFQLAIPQVLPQIYEYVPASLSILKGNLPGGTPSVPSSSHLTQVATENRKPKLHLLLPAHNSNHDLCGCLRTHLINGFEPLLVNFGHDAGGDRANKYYKLEGVYNFLKNATANNIQPGDVIAIMDGFDVWSQQPAHVLLDRFLASDKRIVLGVDKNCFPNDPAGPVCNDIPHSPLPSDIFGPGTDKDKVNGSRNKTRPRWVNSGTVIGYYEDLLRLYESMTDFHDPSDDHKSDQRVFAVHYYWGNFSLSLDFMAEMVVSVAFSTAELKFMDAEKYAETVGIEPWVMPDALAADLPEDLHEFYPHPKTVIPRIPIVRYSPTDTVPVMLHFPGVAKRLMNSWNAKMWWAKAMRNSTEIFTQVVMDKEVKIVESGEVVTFRTLCGKFMSKFTYRGAQCDEGRCT